jgi:hypothetical protein
VGRALIGKPVIAAHGERPAGNFNHMGGGARINRRVQGGEHDHQHSAGDTSAPV